MSLKEQFAVELDAKDKQLCKKLVKEHMSKFKDVTDKLQQVHQSELDSLNQEKEELDLRSWSYIVMNWTLTIKQV